MNDGTVHIQFCCEVNSHLLIITAIRALVAEGTFDHLTSKEKKTYNHTPSPPHGTCTSEQRTPLVTVRRFVSDSNCYFTASHAIHVNPVTDTEMFYILSTSQLPVLRVARTPPEPSVMPGTGIHPSAVLRTPVSCPPYTRQLSVLTARLRAQWKAEG